MCETVTPELTTISQEMFSIGSKASDLIIEYINNGTVLEYKTIYAHKLIKRSTT